MKSTTTYGVGINRVFTNYYSLRFMYFIYTTWRFCASRPTYFIYHVASNTMSHGQTTHVLASFASSMKFFGGSNLC